MYTMLYTFFYIILVCNIIYNDLRTGTIKSCQVHLTMVKSCNDLIYVFVKLALWPKRLLKNKIVNK